MTSQSVPAREFAAPTSIAFSNVDLTLGGQAILEGIDFNVGRGEFLSVMGPSGCGKTTLLRLAAGLVAPTRGKVTFEGQPVLQPRPDVAVVFQDYADALLPWRTAAGNIALVYETLNVAKAERADRIAEILNRVGLGAHAHKYPRQMSGGMQQRLQIARCLAQSPRVWLMDEPFGALDAITRQSLQDEILKLCDGGDNTVIFVTHDVDEALYLGDRVIALRPHPGRMALCYEIPLPRPRNQTETPAHPEFLNLRRALLDFIKAEQH